MEMNEEFLEINDLDWFASCQDGVLAHFATKGRGFVPLAVRESISAYEKIYDYFYSMAGNVDVEVVEINLPEFGCNIKRERYLQSFIEVAKRGVFSYDANDDGGYKLIVRPKTIRRVFEVPAEIKNILLELTINASADIGIDDFI